MKIAAETGHEALVGLLCDGGIRQDVKLNEGDEPALIIAARRGHDKVAKLLLKTIHSRDKFGRQAIHWAADYGNQRILKLLIDRTSINEKCGFGETPLIRAVKGRYPHAAQLLINHGADPSLPDIRGSTPLWWASVRGDGTMVALLLKATKAVNIQSSENSPAWWARRNGHVRIAEILEAHASKNQAPVVPKILQKPPVRPRQYARVTAVVSAQINGVTISPMIGTGANGTLMSESFSRACGIFDLIDRRFEGVARGVSTGKIIGRVHAASIELGGHDFFTSYTIIERMGCHVILGLDFLRRNRCSIDFHRNQLILPFEKTVVPIFDVSDPSCRVASLESIGNTIFA